MKSNRLELRPNSQNLEQNLTKTKSIREIESIIIISNMLNQKMYTGICNKYASLLNQIQCELSKRENNYDRDKVME